MTRIIAGQARGRTITVPEEGTRPTSDRAREGLFSSLAVRWGFEGSYVLDLFAGSGALGLEAATRGAGKSPWWMPVGLPPRPLPNKPRASDTPKDHTTKMKAATIP